MQYILLDVLLCSITEYFYELCRILARRASQNTNNDTNNDAKQRVKLLSDTSQQNV